MNDFIKEIFVLHNQWISLKKKPVNKKRNPDSSGRKKIIASQKDEFKLSQA